MIAIKKHTPVKLDLYYKDKKIGLIENDVEFMQSRLDVLKSREYENYYWTVSSENTNWDNLKPDTYGGETIESAKEFECNYKITQDHEGVLSDWRMDIYQEGLSITLDFYKFLKERYNN